MLSLFNRYFVTRGASRQIISTFDNEGKGKDFMYGQSDKYKKDNGQLWDMRTPDKGDPNEPTLIDEIKRTA